MLNLAVTRFVPNPVVGGIQILSPSCSRSTRRVEGTTQRLREALLTLIVERGYENTTVEQILVRANCGRSTFYSHFRSKEDLLRSVLHRMRTLMVQEAKSLPPGDPGSGTRMGFTLPLFREVVGLREVYRAINGREGGEIVMRQLRRILGELVREDLRSRRSSRNGALLLELEVQYCVGALMSVLRWWMDNGAPLSPEDLNRICGHLISSGLNSPC